MEVPDDPYGKGIAPKDKFSSKFIPGFKVKSFKAVTILGGELSLRVHAIRIVSFYFL
jgi:hypothetical protein